VCGELKVPNSGLFFEEKRGYKTLAELQQEMRKKQREDREKAQKKALMEEQARIREKQEKKERIQKKKR